MYKTFIVGPPYEGWHNTLAIMDDNGTREYNDSGEPEDNTFTRDWSWIETELAAAYAQGKKDGEKK